MSQDHPLLANRSFLVLLIPVGIALLIVLSGNWLYEVEKNQALIEKKQIMEQKLSSKQAAPLRGGQSCKTKL